MKNILLALISFIIGVAIIMITGWNGHWETFTESNWNFVSMFFFILFPLFAFGVFSKKE